MWKNHHFKYPRYHVCLTPYKILLYSICLNWYNYMKLNTSWGSIWFGEDGSLKIGEDGLRYAGERGAKGLDFPYSYPNLTLNCIIITIITKEIKPISNGFQKSEISSCFLFRTICFLNKKYKMKGKQATKPHA